MNSRKLHLAKLLLRRSLLSWYEIYGLRQQELIYAWGLQQSSNRDANPLTRRPRRYWSQADEDGILEEVLARVGPDMPGTFVEFGVGNGSECNTLALLAKGWHGAWIGGEDLMFQPHSGGRLSFMKEWVTASNVGGVFQRALRSVRTDSPDVISMDLDGNDYHFTQKLLATGLRPRTWIAEYNARFPVGVRWVMDYDGSHSWALDDHFGASLTSIVDLFESFSYFPVACSVQGANVFFVDERFRDKFLDIPTNLAELYQPPLYGLVPDWGHEASAKTLRSLTRPL